MSFDKHYKMTTKSTWKGRDDGDANLRWHQVISRLDLRDDYFLGSASKKQNKEQKPNKKLALLGFCCDEGVRRNLGRAGAKEGPKILRKTLANLAVHFDETIQIFDAGDIHCEGDDLEAAQAALAEAVSKLIANNFKPIVLGGGHETAYGHYRGILYGLNAKHDKNKNQVGIINFDAHFDLRPLVDSKFGSSGTPFLEIANLCQEKEINFDYMVLGINALSNTAGLFETAKNLKVKYHMHDEISSEKLDKIKTSLDKFISKNKEIYLTICLDVFAAAHAPGVSAPAAFGIDPNVFLTLFKHIINNPKTISLDIVELSPRFDIDNRTAKLASQIIGSAIT